MKNNAFANTIDSTKLRGGYYTPSHIADFISSWAIRSSEEKVLEPSCGDGVFIESSIKRFVALGSSVNKLGENLKAIELIPAEALKASEKAASFGLGNSPVINADFFSYISSNLREKYDVILGNPPFIRYQNFPEKHRSIAIRMMEDLGLRPNRLTNIWVPFLVICSSLLTKNGRLGMVIPAELFQVKYASETRVFLATFFDRITIITFTKLVFDGIQQEVVLLLCEKDVHEAQGIRVLQLDDLSSLDSIDFEHVTRTEVKKIHHSSEKWTKYFLSKKEIKLLRSVKQSGRIPKADTMLDVNVGIVTGRNKFFMLKESQVRKWNLQNFTQKVVSKSKQLEGVTFGNSDFANNAMADRPIFLFLPPLGEFSDLPMSCKEYIKHGENEKFHEGYKCRIRKKWYITPSLWNPMGFALRQVNGFPKLVLNSVDASSTDTIHRVKFISSKYSPEAIVVCFLNSLTFAFSEITGRSYGGGVMTFEPTEIEELLIPVIENHGIDLEEIDELMRMNKITTILDIVDKAVLIDGYGFSKKETLAFRNIWRKMSDRRIKRGKSAKSK